MKKIIMLLVLLAILAGAYYGFSEFNRGNVGAGNADFKVSTAELFEAFDDDESAANAKYLDKTVEVTGVIQKVSKGKDGKTTVTLDGGMMFGITCEMFESEKLDQSKYKKGEKITLKGICTGYLSDVVLVRCVGA